MSRRRELHGRQFGFLLAGTVGLAAVIRFAYALTVKGLAADGFYYHLVALRFADGDAYTSPFGDLGAPIAHHPPGWETLLGIVSWLGARSLRDHRLVGAVIGLGVVVLAGLVGRRYFDARVGLVAALLAALYPGFWLLEGSVLSEPLGLLVLGLFFLVIADVRDRPTVPRSVAIGALCGVLALVRSEQLLLLFIVVVPVLLFARALSMGRRVLYVALALVACGAVIAPWTVFNATRFRDPVLLSTNDGGLLLAGNCPPSTYTGRYLGFYGGGCIFAITAAHPRYDRSQVNVVARRTAVRNINANLSKMPVVVPARFGRLLAVYRPSQTVRLVSQWMATDTTPIWAWVVSFWALLLLGIIGLVRAVRARAFVLPLLGPAIVVIFEVAISYGEPRYHAMADLSVIVFAAAAVDALLFRGALHASMTRAAPPGDTSPPEEERVAAPVAQRSGFTKMKQ